MNVTLEKAVLTLLSIINGVWMISWVIGRWTQEQETSNRELDKRVTMLERKPDGIILEKDIKRAHERMDTAGHEMSELATDVQGMEQRIRVEFMSRELVDQYVHESREDRKHLWDAMEKLQRRTR